MLKIRELRKKLGISQKKLSEELHVSQPTLWAWEMGTAFPRAKKLADIAKYFGCSIDDLFEKER